VEAVEHEYPLRVRAYRIRDGSGGDGAHRGGDGIRRCLEFLCPCDVTILSDRRERAPYGLRGGRAGAPGENKIVRNGKASKLPGKVRLAVQPGERLEILTPGGGGYGKPRRNRRPTAGRPRR